MSTPQKSTPVASEAPSRRRLGVPAVTFMIVAASAPLTVLAGGVTTTFAVTGVDGVPLSFLILGAALAIFAVGYAAMSRHITNAGAFYAYIAQGLGRPLGVGSSIVALVSYNAMQVGIYGLFGFSASDLLSSRFGLDIPWYVPVFVCIVIVGILGVNRVDLSAKVLGVLVGLEFVIVIIYDIASFVVAPEGTSGPGFDPAHLFVTGIGAVFAFGIAAFMGFESAAIYSEESKDPRRTVARATYTAVAIIAVFYAISSFAMTIGTGPSAVIDASRNEGPTLIFSFLTSHVGVLIGDIAQLLFLTSIFASLVSFHNAVARYFFSLGREGVLPKGLARLRPGSGAPIAGSIAQTVIAVVIVIAFAVAGAGSELGPLFPVLTLFTWLTNAGAMGLVLLMALVSLSVIGYFRKHNDDRSIWVTTIAPAIAFLALGAVFVLIVLNFNVLLGQTDSTATTFLLPAVVLIPGLIAVVWGVVLKSRKPAVYAQIGHGAESGDPVLGTETKS